jgi:hypothetical protein
MHCIGISGGCEGDHVSGVLRVITRSGQLLSQGGSTGNGLKTTGVAAAAYRI